MEKEDPNQEIDYLRQEENVPVMNSEAIKSEEYLDYIVEYNGT